MKLYIDCILALTNLLTSSDIENLQTITQNDGQVYNVIKNEINLLRYKHLTLSMIQNALDCINRLFVLMPKAKTTFEQLDGENCIEELYKIGDSKVHQILDFFVKSHFAGSLYDDSSDIFFQQQYHLMPNVPENDERDKFYFDDIAYHESMTPE